MATVDEVLQDAFLYTVIGAAETGIEADEAQSSIRALNDMLTQWDTQGISLGYSKVTNLGDTVTVPDSTLLGIKLNLGVLIAPQYGGLRNADTAILANSSINAIRSLTIKMPLAEFPNTLPKGTGNTPCAFESNFFHDSEAELLTEQNGSITLEDNTDVT